MSSPIIHEDLECIADMHLAEVAQKTADSPEQLAELLTAHINSYADLGIAAQDRLIEQLAHIFRGVAAPVTNLAEMEHVRDLLHAERNWLLRGMNVNEQAVFRLLAQTAERAKADKLPKPAEMDVMVERARTAIELGAARRGVDPEQTEQFFATCQIPECGRGAEQGPCTTCEREAENPDEVA